MMRTVKMNATVNSNPKMNVTTRRHSRANETSRHIMTCHVRHIFLPIDETIKKQFPSCNNLLNAIFQFYPIKMGCCSTNNKCLIVTTINPICHSCPVHHGTNVYVLISLKSMEIIIFAHNFILKQNTNQATHCLDFHLSIVFLVKGLGTSNQLQSMHSQSNSEEP